MEWIIIRRGADGLVIVLLWDQFGQVQSIVEVAHIFARLPELERIGVIAAVALLVSSAIRGCQWIWSRFKGGGRGGPPAQPA